jgi:putative chitinase
MNITFAQLRSLAPTSNAKVVTSLVGPLNKWLPQYGIDTPKRIAHFFAQAAEETDHFKTLHEYASGKEYEGRKDLGNVKAGDGVRYKGRGIFQLTGLDNYRDFGKRLGLDLEGNPELAADPDVCVRTACEYWKKKGLSALADADDINEITRRINGGHNGLDERKRLLGVAKKIFCTLDNSVPESKNAPEPIAPTPKPAAPAAPVKPVTPKPVTPAKPALPIEEPNLGTFLGNVFSSLFKK